MTSPVHDITAKRLEAAGLWRRASARWLEVMMQEGLTSPQQAWVCYRRRYCQAQLPGGYVPEKPDIVAIGRAASATLKRMGLHLGSR